MQSASASPVVSYGGGAMALPSFRDDVWAGTPLPANLHGQQGQKWCEEPQQQQPQQQRQRVMDCLEEETVTVVGTDAKSTRTVSPYRQRYDTSTCTTVSHPGSVASSPYYQAPPPPPYSHSRSLERKQEQQEHHQQTIRFNPVPSAPFANAGPPGVGVHFYAATPEVERRVQMGMEMRVEDDNAYTSGGTSRNVYSHQVGATRTAVPPLPPAHRHGTTTSTSTSTYTYTYSGAHSTSSSPYHSAVESYAGGGFYHQPGVGRY